MDENLAQRLNRIRSSQTLMLTHHGRKSDKPYEVVIWFAVEGDRMYLATANVNRQWVRNVMVKPQVTLKAGSEVFSGKVRRITDTAERDRVMNLFMSKYWYALPFILVGRALQAFGLAKDNTGAFEVALEAGAA
jgi:deazaflavin-dependent oxidoreductase (nitroreductase family)